MSETGPSMSETELGELDRRKRLIALEQRRVQ